MEQNDNQNDNEILKVFKGEMSQTVLTIISYSILLFMSIYIGFNLDNYFFKIKNKEKAKKIASIILGFVWLFLLIGEIIQFIFLVKKY